MQKREPGPQSSAFPILVCEAQISRQAKLIDVSGKKIPPPNLNPKKIVVLGDTGCVIKETERKLKVQACNDPNKWPFAQISQSAADWNPDLVIHVGDYHYREATCPDFDPKCAGAISGDSWASWEQDFFAPAAPLLSAAPWIFLRGNHELCARAGTGWFNLLDPRPAPANCNDQTDPYRIPLGGVNLNIVDSATDQNTLPSLAKLASIAQPGDWLVSHRPFLTPGADDEATVQFSVSSIPEVLQSPGRLGLVLTGHQHRLSLNQFPDSRPPELISGNGGTQLDKLELASSFAKLESPSFNSSVFTEFGFLTFERTDDSPWQIAIRNTVGTEIARCDFKQQSGQKTTIQCNAL
jgi:hypothetical protein